MYRRPSVSRSLLGESRRELMGLLSLWGAEGCTVPGLDTHDGVGASLRAAKGTALDGVHALDVKALAEPSSRPSRLLPRRFLLSHSG